MSEDEKKAIKVIKHRIGLLKSELEVENEYKDDEPRIFYLMEQIQSNEVILNLIENKQKEIEKYKKQIDLEYVEDNYVLKELYEKQKKEIEELKQENNFLKNQELGYIAGYEDGKKHKQTAVAIKNENMKYELYNEHIKSLQKEIEELEKYIKKLVNCHLRYEELTGIDLLVEE